MRKNINSFDIRKYVTFKSFRFFGTILEKIASSTIPAYLSMHMFSFPLRNIDQTKILMYLIMYFAHYFNTAQISSSVSA